MFLMSALLDACVSLPPNVERKPSSAFTDTQDTSLGLSIKDDLVCHPGLSGFLLLPNGLDAFAARALLADSAERSIDAQYYLLHKDLVGRLFLSALLKAADRGVRVRLLVDDMTLDDDKDIGMAALDAHPMVEIRVFNPFTRKLYRWLQILARFDDITRRMHNKSFTVDNQFSVVGGRNIGNEYFEADPELAFGDLDTLAIGPVVGEISTSFDLYWNSQSSYPISALLGKKGPSQDLERLRRVFSQYVQQQRDSEYLQALRNSNLVAGIKDNHSNLVARVSNNRFEMNWGNAQVLYDDPSKVTTDRAQTELHLVTQFEPLSSQIRQELTIFSPYFIPGRQGVKNIQKLCEQGVQVRILTNSLASTDVTAVHAGYARYRRRLLRAGVELYEIDDVLSRAQRKEKKGPSGSSKASLHAKSFVIDRKRVFIGSMNLDPRSAVENTEIGLIIDSTEIAREMNDWFNHEIDKVAYRVSLETNKIGKEKLLWYRRLEGEDQRFTSEPNAGFWRRFGVRLLQLLPFESLL